MRFPLLPVFAVFMFVFSGARPAAADSSVYQDGPGNDYSHGLDTSAVLRLAQGATIDFAGLSGVTGATDSLPGLFDLSFPYPARSGAVETFLDPNLFSNFLSNTSMAPPETVNYGISAKTFNVDGSMADPAVFVTATPQPSGLLLLGAGLIGTAAMVTFMRKTQVDD